jgi:hypothetical protein
MASQDPQLSASKEAFSSDCFEHTALDTTSNPIRLSRILPNLSNTGLIQCELWHATTHAEYTCLSYVWGAEANQETIRINGKRLFCRRNLREFLSVARITHNSGPKAFWIDAICIKQVSISERNHQVHQMGDIYARATDVVVWLGRDQGAVEFLVFLNRLAAEHRRSKKDARRKWYRESTKGLRRSYLDSEVIEYWTRAWITQEILQAQELSILVKDTRTRQPESEALVLLLPTLQLIVSKPRRKSSDEFWRTADRYFEIYVRAIAGYALRYQRTAGWSEPTEKGLLDLLFFLGPRRCQVPRERVHSLLTIAEDPNLLPVDFSMPEHVFVWLLFVSYNRIMCLCSLARLTDDVLNCVEPFTSSAPQSLLVELSLTTSEPQKEPRPQFGLTRIGKQLAKLDRIVCVECDNEILIDPVREHVSCLSQECWHTEGHLIALKNIETSLSGTKSTIKLVTPHEEGGLEHPLLCVTPCGRVIFWTRGESGR